MSSRRTNSANFSVLYTCPQPLGDAHAIFTEIYVSPFKSENRSLNEEARMHIFSILILFKESQVMDKIHAIYDEFLSA